MTGDESTSRRRRQLLCGLAATGLASATAGCLGGGGSDGGDTPAPTMSSPSGETATMGGTDTSTAAGETSATDSGADGSVTASVSLSVRSSQSNVDQFETLQTTFEAVELVSTDGSTVRLDDTTMDIDLTSVGAGGSVDLFETTVLGGAYQEARLYLPIQTATLADGGDPEFERTVPASRELQGDPIELPSGENVDLGLTVALLRIAGDGPWTYTLGWGIQ